MKCNVYLTFDNGNCAKAFDFYKSIFGGEFGYQMTYADSPMKDQVEKDHLGYILHMSLEIGTNLVLMGCDRNPVLHKEDFVNGNNYQLSLQPETKEETDRIFGVLSSDGGKVGMELKDMFWGSYFGTVTDKFGVQWMLDCANSDTYTKEQIHKTVKSLQHQLVELEKMVKTPETKTDNNNNNNNTTDFKGKKHEAGGAATEEPSPKKIKA